VRRLLRLTTLLWLLVAVAAASAGPALVARVQVESASRRVELVMDLDLVELLARSQGYRTDQVLTELAQAGLGAVAWTGTTLDRLSLSGYLGVYEGRDLADLIATGRVGSPDLLALDREGFFQAGYTYACTADREVGRWLERAAATYLPDGRHRVTRRGSLTVLEISLLKERAVQLSLGLLPAELERAGVGAAGLRVMARPPNAAASASPEGVADVEATLTSVVASLRVTLSAVAFSSSEVLGYPGSLDETVAMVKRVGVPVAVFETIEQLGNVDQKGLSYVASRLGYQIVRIYTAPEVKVLTPAELADKIVRSVKERGLRVAYLHPYLVAPEHLLTTVGVTRDGRSVYAPPPDAQGRLDYTPLLALNVNYVRDLVALLQSQGFEVGAPEPLSVPNPSRPAPPALLGLGASAALGLCWLALRPRGRLWVASGLLASALVAAAIAALAATGRGTLGLQLAALTAALAFPSLALSYLAARWTATARPAAAQPRGPWPAVFGDLLVVTGISLLGGLLVAAILTDIRFMLEFEYFRGVKLTYLVPPVAGLAYWLRYRFPGETEPRAWPRVILRLAGWPIRVWHVAVAGVVGAGLVLYVARSGNTRLVPLLGFELRLRQWLEAVLYARPRLKETFIGYPSLVLGSWLAHTGRREHLGWLMLGAGVSQVSLVNSFEHIRSPLVLSLIRSFNGLWTGVLVGLAAVGILWALAALVRRLGTSGGRGPEAA